MNSPIITSLTDTDYYTFTLCQLAYHKFKGAAARYKYKCRNGNGYPPALSVAGSDKAKRQFCGAMNKQLDNFCELRFKHSEVEALSKTGHFKDDFLEFLLKLRLDRKHITCYDANGHMAIDITGPVEQTIWYETPTLATNSELIGYYNVPSLKIVGDLSEIHDPMHYEQCIRVARERLYAKLKYAGSANLPGFNITDFGTRRRFSLAWHDEVLYTMKQVVPEILVGTSNCMLAMKHGIPMKGTMPHQGFQMFQQVVGVAESQTALFAAWIEEYGDQLLIALSDILGFQAFIADFLGYAKDYSGARHDSANPYLWCEDLLLMYEKLGIDAKKKVAVFSNGLNMHKAVSLYATFHNKIKVMLAMGTDLTNDTGRLAPQIVIKLVEFMHGPVAKVADEPGKGMCEDPEFEDYVKEIAARKRTFIDDWKGWSKRR